MPSLPVPAEGWVEGWVGGWADGAGLPKENPPEPDPAPKENPDMLAKYLISNWTFNLKETCLKALKDYFYFYFFDIILLQKLGDVEIGRFLGRFKMFVYFYEILLINETAVEANFQTNRADKSIDFKKKSFSTQKCCIFVSFIPSFI